MTIRLAAGDCRVLLRALPAASVQCVVTSPPYYGLRNYKADPLVWGGDPEHVHEWGGDVRAPWANKLPSARSATTRNNAYHESMGKTAGAFCACGAWLGSLGLEPTPALYVQHMVEVMAEVWRVLRTDGTLWLNLGDSYAQYTENGRHDANVGTDLVDSPKWAGSLDRSWRGLPQGTKRKDLLLMPSRVALALQDGGWWVRSDIAWRKRSFLPDPAPDRPSSAWEHVFLLTRSDRYYYDAAAVREAGTPEQDAHNQRYAHDDYDVQLSKPGNGQPGNVNHRGIHARPRPGGHNMRNYWVLGPEPFPDAHFAVMPSEVARRCIFAGSKRGDTVLDPFVGSGTTMVVADRHGRDGIGFDLNPEYAAMAERRVRLPIDAPSVKPLAGQLPLV